MRARRSLVAFGVLVAFVAGCSVLADFSDLTGAEADAGIDAPLDAIGFRDVAVIDAGVDATFDATPAPCNPSFSIATDGGLNTLKAFSIVSHYPNVESFMGDETMVLLPFRDTSIVDAGPDAGDAAPMQKQQEIMNSHVGLWTPSAVPTVAFDVTFDAKIVCTNGKSCADGLIFAVLDMTTTSSLNNGNSGNAAGLPSLTNGFGLDVDDFQNGTDESSDPYAPSLQIIALDSSKTPGNYPWQVQIVHSSFPGNTWHTYALRLRGTTLTASFDGATALTGQVTAIANGMVGLTAGTGGESDAVAIRNLAGQFYACTP